MMIQPKYLKPIMALVGAAVMLTIAAAVFWGLVPVGSFRRTTLAFAFALMAAMDIVGSLFWLARA